MAAPEDLKNGVADRLPHTEQQKAMLGNKGLMFHPFKYGLL